MSDILDEDLVPFAAGIRLLPGRPHISSGYRFISRGCRGIRLQTVVVGGRRYVSRRALRQFVHDVTVAANGNTPPPPHATHDDSGIRKDLDAARL
jgi:hypothetical protein